MINLINKIFRREKKYKLEDVFTPSSAAVLTYVVRPELDKQLNKSIVIPGMQLILYGHSGSGKTTLIQNSLRAKNIAFISTNCMIGMTINEIILDAFDKLNSFYTSEISSKNTSKIDSEIKTSYLTVNAAIKSEVTQENGEKRQRILPIQLTPQRLAEFLGAAKVIWIIEDFHKVKEDERKKLSQILKIFVDISNKYKDVKIVAVGAVGTAREVVNYDNELTNRVSEVLVPLMNKEEIESIIVKGETFLNVEFCRSIRDDIIKFSNSLASICHQLCYNICDNNAISFTQKVKKEFTDEKSFTEVIGDYLKQNSDSLKKTTGRALKAREGKFDNTKPLLEPFCKDKEELTYKEVSSYKDNENLYGDNIQKYLKLLTTKEYGEILKFDIDTGRFSFSNPFYKVYITMHFYIEEKQGKSIFELESKELLKVVKDIKPSGEKEISTKNILEICVEKGQEYAQEVGWILSNLKYGFYRVLEIGGETEELKHKKIKEIEENIISTKIEIESSTNNIQSIEYKLDKLSREAYSYTNKLKITEKEIKNNTDKLKKGRDIFEYNSIRIAFYATTVACIFVYFFLWYNALFFSYSDANIYTSVIDSQFFIIAINNGNYLGLVVSLLLTAFPILLSYFFHSKDNKLKIINYSALCFAFAIDVFLAYRIAEHIFVTNKSIGIFAAQENFTLFKCLSDMSFWLMLSISFFVHIIWGMVFFRLKALKRPDEHIEILIDKLQEEIITLSNNLDECNSNIKNQEAKHYNEINNIEYLKKELEYNEKNLEKIKIKPITTELDLRMRATSFYVGFIRAYRDNLPIGKSEKELENEMNGKDSIVDSFVEEVKQSGKYLFI